MVCFTCKPLSSSSSLTAASTILSPLSSLPQNECCHSPLEVLQCCYTTKGNTCQNLSFSAQVATAPPSRPSHRQSIFSFGRVASCKFHINYKSLYQLHIAKEVFLNLNKKYFWLSLNNKYSWLSLLFLTFPHEIKLSWQC